MNEQAGDVLESVGAVIAAVAEAAGAATVSVGRDGRGSGFVVAAGRVVTSAHNLRGETVAVGFADGRNEQGRVHATDGDGDLAVIDVDTAAIEPLVFADATPAVGMPVVALARGGHRPRVTVGFVSGVDRAFDGPRGRTVRGGFEHTAALARGSSGGPVLSVRGQVLGVDTHRVGDGFYLARTADAALQARIAELVAGSSPRRFTLGVAIAPPTVAAELRRAVGLPVREGLLVRGVTDGGPAARAGIQVGDLLVRAGGTTLVDVDALQDALAAATATLAVDVVRGADELGVTVVFDDAAPPPA
jgi:S1-C subfamily serine protease